ncbi:hypothetical protein [Bradyrhizobium valentinum]|uniref:Uncharacterized protein n=1 Tax=Bradyrhizobium valentinum TaxID=1518501 RepID=A0A0R3KUS3_9BRAD|nr:hypothetical protein [Bradyrhizobium valentinum]KRQ99264.1 hypothetical protein CP49_11750 [Bradyrhizobium valentinum]
MKAPHPDIEARAIDAIRKADHFTASIFLGRGKHRVVTAPTVWAAVRAARIIETDPQAFTRRAIIYAIASDGIATMITAELIQKLTALVLKTESVTP